MSSYALNAITAPDAYTQAATVEGAPIRRINLDVLNQAVYWQLKISDPAAGVGGVWDSTEVFMSPGSRSLNRRCVGIRVRAATKAASLPAGSLQAVVTLEAVGA